MRQFPTQQIHVLISFCSISGEIGNLFAVLPTLSKLDISYNLFIGEVSAIPPSVTVCHCSYFLLILFLRLQVLIIDGNPDLADQYGQIPPYLQTTSTYIKDVSGNTKKY